MSKIFKPRRGTTYTMRSTNKKSTVLAKGEMFVEVPNTGVGTGPSKIIIGDGVTTFENLPVALSGTTTSDVTTDSSTSVSSALNNVISGKEMSNLFGSLKQAISLNASTISGLNNKVPFTLAISNGAYGYKNSSGTFVAFKSQADIDAAISAAKVGTATAAQVLTGYTFTNSSGSGINGSMPNQGKKTQSLNCGGSYTIPAGYHNGQGSVTANSLASQTKVDNGKTAVTAGAMVSGYQGWVNGTKITGTFTGQPKSTTSSRSNQTIIPDSGKYLTSVTITGLLPSGTYPANVRGSQVDMGATSNFRYVNTTNVPNSNSGTFTFDSTNSNLNGDTKDLTETNTIRFVNANNVYNHGRNVGYSEGYSQGHAQGKIDGVNELGAHAVQIWTHGEIKWFPGDDGWGSNDHQEVLSRTTIVIDGMAVDFFESIGDGGSANRYGSLKGTLTLDSYAPGLPKPIDGSGNIIW